MFKLDNAFSHALLEKARCSPRLRAHYNIHTSYDEPVQRIVIALCKGTYIPPHYHEKQHQWEHFQVINGRVKVIIFDVKGMVVDTFFMSDEDECHAFELPPNMIHTLVCCSDYAIILEVKQGPFNPCEAKVIPNWSIAEDDQDSVLYLNRLADCEKGDCLGELLQTF